MDNKLVSIAVKIKMSLLTNPHSLVKVAELQADLRRLRDSMNTEENNDYQKRISTC